MFGRKEILVFFIKQVSISCNKTKQAVAQIQSGTHQINFILNFYQSSILDLSIRFITAEPPESFKFHLFEFQHNHILCFDDTRCYMARRYPFMLSATRTRVPWACATPRSGCYQYERVKAHRWRSRPIFKAATRRETFGLDDRGRFYSSFGMIRKKTFTEKVPKKVFYIHFLCSSIFCILVQSKTLFFGTYWKCGRSLKYT